MVGVLDILPALVLCAELLRSQSGLVGLDFELAGLVFKLLNNVRFALKVGQLVDLMLEILNHLYHAAALRVARRFLPCLDFDPVLF